MQHAIIAQSVEHYIGNVEVAGSSPANSSILSHFYFFQPVKNGGKRLGEVTLEVTLWEKMKKVRLHSRLQI